VQSGHTCSAGVKESIAHFSPGESDRETIRPRSVTSSAAMSDSIDLARRLVLEGSTRSAQELSQLHGAESLQVWRRSRHHTRERPRAPALQAIASEAEGEPGMPVARIRKRATSATHGTVPSTCRYGGPRRGPRPTQPIPPRAPGPGSAGSPVVQPYAISRRKQRYTGLCTGRPAEKSHRHPEIQCIERRRSANFLSPEGTPTIVPADEPRHPIARNSSQIACPHLPSGPPFLQSSGGLLMQPSLRPSAGGYSYCGLAMNQSAYTAITATVPLV